ncbi:hypothetical protein AVEN_194000-1 [Araneus ventricosus]|uniref:Uncharacterized protein n=1 Tax=Araneus ventricosus TaxID=182803 RepID=A0A4Y2SWH8_ARAVE|nr:hypothetical protein AVEN_194000-1 [Araneus ventricosus]
MRPSAGLSVSAFAAMPGRFCKSKVHQPQSSWCVPALAYTDEELTKPPEHRSCARLISRRPHQANTWLLAFLASAKFCLNSVL